jgi:mRNA interferase RelE/StbE
LAWQIELTDAALKQLKKLDKSEAKRIIRFLHERVATMDDPRLLAKPLKGQEMELWRFRVGHYRVITSLDDDVFQVLVVRVSHRKSVYTKKF